MTEQHVHEKVDSQYYERASFLPRFEIRNRVQRAHGSSKPLRCSKTTGHETLLFGFNTNITKRVLQFFIMYVFVILFSDHLYFYPRYLPSHQPLSLALRCYILYTLILK
jgi:hypothetical protein